MNNQNHQDDPKLWADFFLYQCQGDDTARLKFLTPGVFGAQLVEIYPIGPLSTLVLNRNGNRWFSRVTAIHFLSCILRSNVVPAVSVSGESHIYSLAWRILWWCWHCLKTTVNKRGCKWLFALKILIRPNTWKLNKALAGDMIDEHHFPLKDEDFALGTLTKCIE